jgi:hypothetical protein
VICPRCGAEGAVKSGGGRGRCPSTGHTFNWPAPALNDAENLPEGFKIRGTSTLTDTRTGETVMQWVKTSADEDALRRALAAVVESLKQEVKGLAKPIKAPKARSLVDSLSAYMIGDAHFGAYAWAAETGGEDFDTNIASADLRAAIDLLVAGAPDSETAYLVDVGDYLHADNRSNMTPASGNLLDVDTRYQRVIRIASEAMRYCIGRMLEKHKRVKVFVTPGNHNPDSAGWMAMVMEAYYSRDKRVEVETSPSKFYYQRFGKNLIGITHGDKIKLGELPSIMATDRAEDWGQTTQRYWWTGHIHHTKHQEYRGCTVEAFNTLAAGDAWHAGSGYRAARQMQRIDIDRTHGIYNRGIASVGMIRALAA